MTALEFHRLCERHDWDYQFSDDHRVYKRGDAEEDKLQALTRAHPGLKPIYVAWDKFHAQKGPRPEAPLA